MTTKQDRSGIDALTHGDAGDARELRANIAVFARQSNSPRIRKMVAEVLAGKRDVREIFRTPEFTAVLGRRLGNLEAGIAALSEKDRAMVFDQTRPRTPAKTLDALRDAH